MDDKSVYASDGLYAQEIFKFLDDQGLQVCEDLHFLVMVALTVEQRYFKWQSRTYNSLQLALKMNNIAGNKLDGHQLVAAILAHDFAMGFLPFETINKSGKFNAKERKLMRTHINSAAELINRMQQWPDAKEMIIAHHEHVDGSGYPNGLRDDEIPEGAKVLAIIDAFTAQGNKKIMHGVMEINRCSDTHFSSSWLIHFNEAVKQIFKPGD